MKAREAAGLPVVQKPADATWLDYLSGGAQNFALGAGETLFAGKEMVERVAFDYTMENTDAGRQLGQQMSSLFPGMTPLEVQNMLYEKQFRGLLKDAPVLGTATKLQDYISRDLRKNFEAMPREVQESTGVQLAGVGGQIAATAAVGAIPVVGAPMAAGMGFSQGFMAAYDESRQAKYDEQGNLVRDGASFGKAVTGGLISGGGGAILEPLGARAVSGVGRTLAGDAVGKVLDRWNKASGGAGSKMFDAIRKRAAKNPGAIFDDTLSAAAKKVTKPVIGKYADNAFVAAGGRVGRAAVTEFGSEWLEQILTNLGVKYATGDELSLLRDAADSGVLGGQAGGALRLIIEGIAGIRARRARKAGSADVRISPVVGAEGEEIPIFDEDGTPRAITQMGLAAIESGSEFAARNGWDLNVVDSYVSQIINTRGQTGLPTYIPEDVTPQELAVVIASEKGLDGGVALKYANQIKDRVAARLKGQPLEPKFEPSIDPNDVNTWPDTVTSNEEAKKIYDEEFLSYNQKLEEYLQKLEEREAVAKRFGEAYLGGNTEGDEMRLQRAAEDGRMWLQFYGDPEQLDKNGNRLLPGKLPPEKIARFQLLWQKLLNEEFALELVRKQVSVEGQVGLTPARERAEAIALAEKNIARYKDLLDKEYAGTVVEDLYTSGVERKNWSGYLSRVRTEELEVKARYAALMTQRAAEEEAEADRQAQELARQSKESAKLGDFGAIEGERRNAIYRGLTSEAQQRAEDYRRAMEAQFEPATPLTASEQLRLAPRSKDPGQYTPTLTKAEQNALAKNQSAYVEALNEAVDSLVVGVTPEDLLKAAYAYKQATDGQTAQNEFAGMTEKEVMQVLGVEEKEGKLQPAKNKPAKPLTAKELAKVRESFKEAAEALEQQAKASPVTQAEAPAAPAPAPAPAAPAAPTAPPLKLDFVTAAQKQVLAELVSRVEDYPDNQDLVDQYGKDTLDQLVEGLSKPTVEIPAAAVDLFRDTVEDVVAQTQDALDQKLPERSEGQSRRSVRNFLAAANMLYDALPAATPQAAPQAAPAAAPTTAPEPQSQIDAQINAMLDPANNKKFVFVAEGSPQPSVGLVSGKKIYRVNLTGESGGIKGTLYTTDQGLSMSARRRSTLPGGVTEQALDQYLYNQSQGKPKSAEAKVVQRRDKDGKIVASRATDPADVPRVTTELENQVPEGTTTVATPVEELAERQANVDAEASPLPAPATPIAAKLGIDQSRIKEAAEKGIPRGYHGGFAADVFAALANTSSPLTIENLVQLLKLRNPDPASNRMAVADALSRLDQAGFIVQQTTPDGSTYSSLSTKGQQGFEWGARFLKPVPSAEPSTPKIPFGDFIQSLEGLSGIEKAVLNEVVAMQYETAPAKSFAALKERSTLSGFSIEQIEEAGKGLRKNGLLNFDAPFKATEKFWAGYKVALDWAGRATDKGDTFGRPRPRGEAKPAAPEKLPRTPVRPPEIGMVKPGVKPWRARVQRALDTDPGLFEFVTGEEMELLDPTVADTQGAVREATDDQLVKLLESKTPAGLASVATETTIDPVSGNEVVTKIETQAVALDPKKTSSESWMLNRQLAWLELRRRAQAAVLEGSGSRNYYARKNYPPSDPKFGRPSNPLVPGKPDADRPVGYVKGPEGRSVPLFEHTHTALSVTDEPAITLEGEPVSLVDLRDAFNDVFNHVNAPIVQNVEAVGYAGTYDVRNHSVIVGNRFDWPTISHELSHAMVAWIYSAGATGPRTLLDSMPANAQAEALKIGKQLYEGRTPRGGFEHEGLAEALSMWINRNEMLATHYPALHQWIQTEFLTRDVELGQKVVRARQLVETYRFQGVAARSRAASLTDQQQRQRMSPLKRLARLRFGTRILASLVDPLIALRPMQRAARRSAMRKGMTYDQAANDVALNAVDYAEGLIGQADALMTRWIDHHMTKPDGTSINEAVPSLNDALKPIEGIREDFSEYVRLMREQWMLEQDVPRLGPTDPRDVYKRLAQLRAQHGDRLEVARLNLMNWIRNGVMTYVRENDPVFRRAFEMIDESGDTETWVPLERLVYDMTISAETAAGALRTAMDPAAIGPQKVMTSDKINVAPLVGGSAPVRDVLQALESNVTGLLASVHKRMMIRSIVSMAASNPELRQWIYEVRGAVAFDSGVHGDKADPMLSLGENTALMNIQGVNVTNDINNDDRVLIAINDVNAEGEIVARVYSVHRNVADAFGAIAPREWKATNLAARFLMALSKFTVGSVKAAATGVLAPGFQLVAAPLMDIPVLWINNPGLGLNLAYLYPMRYMKLALEQITAPLGYTSKMTKLEQASNKQMTGSPWGMQGSQSKIRYVGKTKSERAGEMAKIWNGDLARLVDRQLSFTSRIARQLAGESAAKQAGWDGKSEVTQVQMFAYIRAYTRTTANWPLAGRLTKMVNQVIPYFGVPIVTTRDFMRASGAQLANPKTRIQFGMKLLGSTLPSILAYALWDDDEDIKALDYETKTRNWAIPLPMEDGSKEILLIPKPTSEFFVGNAVEAILQSQSSQDPNYWGNRTKAAIAAMFPQIIPPAIDFGQAALLDQPESDIQKALIDLLPVGGYELSPPLTKPHNLTPSESMRNPFGTVTGVTLSRLTEGAIDPRKFDLLVDSISGGTLESMERSLMAFGLLEDQRPVGARNRMGDVPILGKVFAKRAGVTMRTPEIRTLFTLRESLEKANRAALEHRLNVDPSETITNQYMIQEQLYAVNKAWSSIVAINYIAQNYEPPEGERPLTNGQRQELMRYAGAIAQEAVTAVYAKSLPSIYDPKKPQTKLPYVPGRTLEEQRTLTEMNQPGYVPKINWPETLNLPRPR